jgi:multidrug efflux pump subunit AcrA (membrane-fusion protein)
MSVPETVSPALPPGGGANGSTANPAPAAAFKFKKVLVAGIVILAAAGVAAASIPLVTNFLNGKDDKGEGQVGKSSQVPVELLQEERTAQEIRHLFPDAEDKEIEGLRKTLGPKVGIRLKREAALGLEPKTAETPKEPRPLPPQVGTVNYDNERLFILKSRFQGEVAVLKTLLEPVTPTKYRPIRYGDSFQQGDLLAVVWSKDLGAQKAALVDAMCALRLSKDQLMRYGKLFEDGALPEAVYRAQERQVQGDSGAVLTAKRTLKMWRLNADEIKEVEDEANKIIDLKLVRDAEYEKKWAEVYITVPKVPKDWGNYQVILVEKNTNLHDMVDPTTIMFKLAALDRLTIWVLPPQEYLPLLQERLKKGGAKWQIQFQSDAPGTKPLDLPILQIAPSIDPNVHSPMVMGYLPNKDHKRLIGQAVTATIFVDPDPDTVAVPTNAINDVEGQMLVFVEKNAKKREYMLRRVAVQQRFHDVSFVRSKLTEQEKKLSEVEKAKGRYPIEPLLPGERVLTNGIVELTVALETLLAEDRLEKQQKQAQGK